MVNKKILVKDVHKININSEIEQLNNEMNEEIRQRFNEYYIKSFKPSLKELSVVCGVSYTNLVNFKNGKNMGFKVLNLINEFLKESNKMEEK